MLPVSGGVSSARIGRGDHAKGARRRRVEGGEGLIGSMQNEINGFKVVVLSNALVTGASG